MDDYWMRRFEETNAELLRELELRGGIEAWIEMAKSKEQPKTTKTMAFNRIAKLIKEHKTEAESVGKKK